MAAGELVLQNIRRDDYKMAGDSLTAGLLKRAVKVHNEMFTNGLGASVGQPLVGGAGGGAASADGAEGAEEHVEHVETQADWENPGALELYRCREGGPEGAAFRRLMVLVGMQCQIRGHPAACCMVDYDTSVGRERVRMRGVWSLTPVGQAHMHAVIAVMRGKPSLLTQLSGTHVCDVRAGLHPRAPWQKRLHALFSMGCTPLGVLVDPEQLSPRQQVTLWEAVVALCRAREGDLDSVEGMAAAFREHARSLGFAVEEAQVSMLEGRGALRGQSEQRRLAN